MSGNNFDLFYSASPDVLGPLEALADDLNQPALVCSPCSNDAAHVAMVASPDALPVRADALTTAATRNAEPTATADPASAASSTKAASKCTQEEMMLPCETRLKHTKIKHDPDKKTGETAEAADLGVRTPMAATPTAATPAAAMPAAATSTLAQVLPTLEQSTEPSHKAATEPTDAIIAPSERLRPTADPAATRKSARTNGAVTAPKPASQPLPKAAAPDKEPEPLPTPTIGLSLIHISEPTRPY